MSSSPLVLEQLMPDLRDDTALPRDKIIFCRFCHAAITSTEQAINPGDSHQHRFTNAHGVHFQIGCFRLAPGCDISGLATLEATWFAHYSWQLAKCSDCGEHLGWFYQNGEADQFYGLIVDKIVRYSS